MSRSKHSGPDKQPEHPSKSPYDVFGTGLLRKAAEAIGGRKKKMEKEEKKATKGYKK